MCVLVPSSSGESRENWSDSRTVLRVEPKLFSEDKMKCERQELGKTQAIISLLCTFIRVILPENLSQHHVFMLENVLLVNLQ